MMYSKMSVTLVRLRAVSRLLIAAALASLMSSVAAESSADLVLYNGKIFTANASLPFVEAIAIRGERIVASGSTATVLETAGPRTRRVDLGGHTVIPGINDAHQHLSVSPPTDVTLAFDQPDPSWEGVMRAIASAVRGARAGTPLFGTIGTAALKDPRANRSSLDGLAPQHPVVLASVTANTFILNGRALTSFHVAENAINPLGGSYGRFPDGQLDGLVRDYAAQALLRARADRTPDGDALRQIRARLAENARAGITSIQDMADEVPPVRIVSLLERAPTPVRVRVMTMPPTNSKGRQRDARPLASRSPLVTISGIKWKLDGNPFDGTRAPSGPDDRYAWALAKYFPDAELSAMLDEARATGDQLILHISGTPAAEAMLDVMERAGAPQWIARRVRFEHGDGLLPELIPRVKALGVLVVQNPSHLDLRGRLGDLTIDSSQLLRSIIEAGIPLAFGSDGPLNPYLNIMLACRHPDRPTESVSREQAVIAYTREAAYAEFTEKDKGTLEPGKLADLAVLSQDIFAVPLERLPQTTAVLTIVGGRSAYDGGDLVER